MAGERKHETPAEQLHGLAITARAEGLTFEQFWEQACRLDEKKWGAIVRTNSAEQPTGAVRWPSDRAECRAWRQAIGEVETGWRRAYERIDPSPSEKALALLGPMFRRLDGDGTSGGMEAQAAVA